jgi:hypothetical protein
MKKQTLALSLLASLGLFVVPAHADTEAFKVEPTADVFKADADKADKEDKDEEKKEPTAEEKFKSLVAEARKNLEDLDGNIKEAQHLKSLADRTTAENELKNAVLASAKIDVEFKDLEAKASKIKIETPKPEVKEEKTFNPEQPFGQPVAGQVGQAPIAPIAVAPVVLNNDTLEVDSIYASSGNAGARIKLNGKKYTVKLGDKLAGYTVKTINFDLKEVVLEKDGFELSNLNSKVTTTPAIPVAQQPLPEKRIIYPFDVTTGTGTPNTATPIAIQ